MRATEQWFADLSGVTKSAEAALCDVTMVPESGRNRLQAGDLPHSHVTARHCTSLHVP
jgi:hypothetical protein